MPLDLETPTEIVSTARRVKITSHTVDTSRQEIHIGYELGDIIEGELVSDGVPRLETIGGPSFAVAIANADSYANAMPEGGVSVYVALKLALYDVLKDTLGFSGSVS